MKYLSPKTTLIIILCVLSLFALGDHLVSPTSPAIASQSSGAQSCAPCGAPCTLTEN